MSHVTQTNSDGRPIFFLGSYYAAADYDEATDSWAVAEGTLVPHSFETD